MTGNQNEGLCSNLHQQNMAPRVTISIKLYLYKYLPWRFSKFWFFRILWQFLCPKLEKISKFWTLTEYKIPKKQNIENRDSKTLKGHEGMIFTKFQVIILKNLGLDSFSGQILTLRNSRFKIFCVLFPLFFAEFIQEDLISVFLGIYTYIMIDITSKSL